jgi:DNA polymerase delta subunit 3
MCYSHDSFPETEDYSSYESVSEKEAVPEEAKKKSRKVDPIRRNGLKKRRTMKNRSTTDAKGYTRMFIIPK